MTRLNVQKFYLTRFYLIDGRYVIGMLGGNVWAFWDYGAPQEGAELGVSVRNLALHSIAVRTISMDEIPEGARDIAGVRARLVRSSEPLESRTIMFKTAAPASR